MRGTRWWQQVPASLLPGCTEWMHSGLQGWEESRNQLSAFTHWANEKKPTSKHGGRAETCFPHEPRLGTGPRNRKGASTSRCPRGGQGLKRMSSAPWRGGLPEHLALKAKGALDYGEQISSSGRARGSSHGPPPRTPGPSAEDAGKVPASLACLGKGLITHRAILYVKLRNI